jgi:hypothetical protein
MRTLTSALSTVFVALATQYFSFVERTTMDAQFEDIRRIVEGDGDFTTCSEEPPPILICAAARPSYRVRVLRTGTTVRLSPQRIIRRQQVVENREYIPRPRRRLPPACRLDEMRCQVLQ